MSAANNYKDYLKYINEVDEKIFGKGKLDYRGVLHSYALTKYDIAFLDYLVDNNYTVIVKKQWNSKTDFIICKDNITMKYSVYTDMDYKHMKSFCKHFEDSFQNSVTIEKLKRRL